MDEMSAENLRDIAAGIRTSSRTLATVALRRELEGMEDVLALRATKGAMDYRQTLNAVREHLSGQPPESVVARVDPIALAALARLVVGRVGADRDFSEAADLFRAARLLRGDASMPADNDRLDAEANLAAGNADYVAGNLSSLDLLEHDRWIIRTELLRVADGPTEAPSGSWLAAFNSFLQGHGLLPVEIRPGPGSPFDRLRVTVPASMRRMPAHAPLVSLIVSTFKPDESLRTAVRSLLNQTWENLEILVVDDGSPPEFDGLLRQVAAMDDRLSVIRMPTNGGTYRIRNHAISVARGDFIGFLDSDDWAHPERIERQLSPLLADDDLMASECIAIRVTSELRWELIGHAPLRRNVSSLVLRRSPVIDALGGFDEARKGSDSEFTDRLEIVFGREAIAWMQLPLGISRLSSGSLSRGEFRYGWMHEARIAYRDAFEHWHHIIGRGETSPRLEPGGPRRFVAPDRMLRPGRPSARRVDVVIVSEWRPLVERHHRADREVTALSEGGLNVAVIHAESVRHASGTRGRPTERMMALQEAGVTSFVTWDEPVTAGLLLIKDPEMLSFFRRPENVGVRAERVVVVAGFPCRIPGDGRLMYAPSVIEQRAQELFGAEPSWLPANDMIAEGLVAEGAIASVLPARHAAVTEIRPRPWSGLRGRTRPVVGTCGLDAPPEDRPTFTMLRALLPDADDYDVRVRAPGAVADRLRRRPRRPVNWLVVDDGELREFYRQADFFVGLVGRGGVRELQAYSLEAMANGCVVVLDPSFEDHFADAAVYARDVDVRHTLASLVQDQAEFGRQQSRGYEFCRRHASAASWLATVNALRPPATIDKENSP